MRTAFINQLTEEAKTNERIFLLVGDLGYSVVEQFANLFPDRYLNVGIAEQNMTGIAAGLALEGYKVFTYSIGNFPTLRAMEQIRYDVCYHNLDVKVVAVGGGYAYASLGTSHHATEELGMLRTIPNMLVAAPGDPAEAKLVTKLLSATTGPAYIRLGKAGEQQVHNNLDQIKLGCPIEVIKGNGKAVFTTGAMLSYTYNHIKANKLPWSLVSFPFIKPFDMESIKKLALSYTEITTIEEHQLSGGFGSSILEAFNDLLQDEQITQMPFIKRVGIKDEFISVAGSQEYIRKRAGLVL